MVKDGEDNNTDYKQRNWKILAKLFKLFNRDIAPLNYLESDLSINSQVKPTGDQKVHLKHEHPN